MSILQKTLQGAGKSPAIATFRAASGAIAGALANTLADMLLPQDCLLCGGFSGAKALCAACHADLPTLAKERCPQCATPTTNGDLCGHCLHKPPHFDATIAAWRYAFPLDRLVQDLKYNGRLALAGLFAEALERALPHDFAVDLLLPVPLHPSKLAERGFNQALEIAKPLAARRGWPLAANLAVRQRPTPSQTALPWAKRAANIKNAFLCPADLSGRRIAVIDDVLTSGATANEFARTLKLCGAAHVSVLTVARAIKD
jgi:ComF family protein